jgi:S1-C subfamily serine protease
MRASGSGVVIDPGEGIILTNARVVDGADEIIVVFSETAVRLRKLQEGVC